MVTNSMSVQPPSLTEVQLPEGRTSAAFTRYTKGLLVKLNEPVGLGNLEHVLTPAPMPGTNSSRAVDVVLASSKNNSSRHKDGATAVQPQENGRSVAASDAESQHSTANGALSTGSSADDTALKAEAREEGFADPPASTECPLVEAVRLHGRELITALRHARHVLRAGLQNLGAVRDEAVFAQRAFFPLMRLLDEVETMINTHSKGSSTGYLAARSWMISAQATVQELDAQASGLLLDSGSGSCLAPDWAQFAQAAALKLRDLEEVLWTGQIFGEPIKHKPRSGQQSRLCTMPRSALSYNTHWRQKIAM